MGTGGNQERLLSGNSGRPNLADIDETHGMDYVELSAMPSIGASAMTSVDPNSSRMTSLGYTRVIHDSFQTFDENRLLYEKLGLRVTTFAWDALWELPWKLIPFVFGLFIIVGFFDNVGLVDFIADSLVSMADLGSGAQSTWIAMFAVGVGATLLCQGVNNQPMTVLLSTVLARVKDNHPELEWITGAYFALAIGANLGGNGTPIASLAVLMWRGILEKWGIFVQYVPFSRKGLGV